MEKEIVFEDKNIIIIKKPFGILSQKDKMGNEKNLYSIVEKYIKYKKEQVELSIINRLDRGVGGLVIFSKNKKTTQILTEYMKEHKFEKRYFAIVYGRTKEEDSLANYIMKNQRLNMSKIVNKNSSGAKETRLSYKKIKELEIDDILFSLIDINLETGRHHQIRLQMANAGFPLLGDSKYNKERQRLKTDWGIGLYSYKVGFLNPSNNEYIEFESIPKNEQIFEKFF